MFENPTTAQLGSFALPVKPEVDGIPLPIDIAITRLSLMCLDPLQKDSTPCFSIDGGESQGSSEYARFMLTLVVGRIETIIPELPNIDDCAVSMWNRHSMGLSDAQAANADLSHTRPWAMA